MATASRALSGAGPVSERARRDVLAAAGALGYRPHPVARSLAGRGRTRIVLAFRDARASILEAGPRRRRQRGRCRRSGRPPLRDRAAPDRPGPRASLAGVVAGAARRVRLGGAGRRPAGPHRAR
ncbi:hypothetical protein ACIA5C_41105 [Actinoplanes sp. NPDC051343]|uniref:hypothetical protein n=1 Tax=Actinoplanes sp. NPDC051343 TaxID=3363906 RepID=UPI003791A391